MSTTFPSFVLLKQHRVYLITAPVAAMIQIIIFKLCYPYADFFSDSYSYIYAASKRLDVNIWPIGYSKFLWLFHQVTSSDTAVVVFQYLLLQTVTLYFFFTLLYFYQPSRKISNIIFGCLFFNPLMLYLSNYISSDSLFLALSLLWVVQLLWIIHQPSLYRLFVHALLIVVLFTLRYNAMYYPLISAFALILSRYKLIWKIAGVVLPLALIGMFVQHTRNVTYTFTGTRQFSIFGGWQLANNALYMYPSITIKEEPPIECREFDQIVKAFFSKYSGKLKSLSPRDGAFYIKQTKAPLKLYLDKKSNFAGDSTGGVISWGTVAPVFSSYGKFLISHHPLAYAKHFLLPNVINYCLPPLEKLEVYNTGRTDVYPLAAVWFHYRSIHVKAISQEGQSLILMLFPAIFLITNLLFIWMLIRWVQIRYLNHDYLLKRSISIITFLVVVNGAFSISASPIVLRYQILPMILCFSFSLIMAGKIDEILSSSKRP